MITVREGAPEQAPQQSRLLSIDPMSQSLYSLETYSFDQSAINSGSALTYKNDSNPRLKIVLAGPTVLNLAKSALVFRLKFTGLEDRAPIYAGDVTSLFEVEQLMINTTSLSTGSSQNYLFNQILKQMQGKNEKANGWLMGGDQNFTHVSGAELRGQEGSTTASGLADAIPSLQKKAFQKIQGSRILNAYRHYAFGSTGPVALTDEQQRRQMNNLYHVPLGDLIPQIASLGQLAERFPLSFVNNVSIVLRLVDPTQIIAFAGHCYESKALASDMIKTSVKYELSDVQLLRVESMWNGDQSRSTYAALLQENRIQNSYTDFEHSSFEIVSNSFVTATTPVSLRDLRFVAVCFTLKDSVISTMPASITDPTLNDLFHTGANFPWHSGITLFQPKLKDFYISLNGQQRSPVSQAQILPQSDYSPALVRSMIKQLIGNSDAYDHGFFETFAQQAIIIPWQREAFSSQNISLADQTNILQVSAYFADQAYQPSANFNVTNLQMHVFRCFDRQLQLGKMTALIY